MAADLHAVAVADHDGHIEAHQRTDVADPHPVGAQDLDRLPFPGEGGRHLAHPRILGPGIGVDLGEQLYLGVEADLAQGVEVGIEAAVGADRTHRHGAGVAGSDRLHGVGGAADRRLGKPAGVGVAGGLARDGPQAEALGLIEAGAFEPAVVEGQGLRLAVFEEELAVVRAL